MTESEILKQVQKICAKHIQGPFSLHLFGSRASGKNTPTSDFDFFVRGKNLSEEQMSQVLNDLEGLDTLFKIDIIDWNKAPQDLKASIKLGPVVEIRAFNGLSSPLKFAD